MPPDSVIDHLKSLVEIYPETNDQEAVKRALDYCRVIIDKTDAFRDTKIHDHNGFYCLTASTTGSKTPKLLLQGHIDVVRALSKPQLQQSDSSLSGRGVYDMLFAIACYMAFIEANTSLLSSLDVGLMLTGEEEIGGFKGVGKLVEEGYGGRVVFLPDAGENFGDLSIECKGAYNFDLVASGVAHHGSRPWEGDGAGNKLVHMIHELMSYFDHSNRDNSTITVTRFDGGGAINRGPSKACAHIDIRTKNAEDLKIIRQHIDKICDKYGGRIENVIEANSLKVNINDPAIQDFVAIYQKYHNQPITYSKAHGGSDARFFAAKGMPVIMIRPDGSGAHSDEETLDLASLGKFYELLEEFILKTAKIN